MAAHEPRTKNVAHAYDLATQEPGGHPVDLLDVKVGPVTVLAGTEG